MTPPDQIKSTIETAFDFLISEYGFDLLETRQETNYKGEFLAVYRNDNSKLQLEISADDSYFHCEIRRLMNGLPARYSDRDNCIGFESLAILESDNNYEHLDYFAGGQNGMNGVLTVAVALFRRHKVFFTTDCWIDTRKIQELRDAEFV